MASDDSRTIVLALQGGGALGAYQVGAYEALLAAGCAPDWVAGISIGAFNAAIIAGNPPDQRLARLTEFWAMISRRDDWSSLVHSVAPKLANSWSYWEALAFGQPDFFRPRFPGPYLQPPGTVAATSFYDTDPLRATLEQVTDFDRINRHADPVPGEPRPPRLSLGVTDVAAGEFAVFDSMQDRIGPEHVMASGALPPGFPAQSIGSKTYWDGGCVSNTPLDIVLEHPPAGHILAFVIDLWSVSGTVPASMDDVQWRQKQIQYASRTDYAIKSAAARHTLRQQAVREESGPDAGGERLDIVHIIYHPAADQVPGSDAEFSRASIMARRAAGLADLKSALKDAPWHYPAPHGGCRVFPMVGGHYMPAYTGVDVAHGRAPSAAALVRQRDKP